MGDLSMVYNLQNLVLVDPFLNSLTLGAVLKHTLRILTKSQGYLSAPKFPLCCFFF